jgi:hypothetical protein
MDDAGPVPSAMRRHRQLDRLLLEPGKASKRGCRAM